MVSGVQGNLLFGLLGCNWASWLSQNWVSGRLLLSGGTQNQSKVVRCGWERAQRQVWWIPKVLHGNGLWRGWPVGLLWQLSHHATLGPTALQRASTGWMDQLFFFAVSSTFKWNICRNCTLQMPRIGGPQNDLQDAWNGWFEAKSWCSNTMTSWVGHTLILLIFELPVLASHDPARLARCVSERLAGPCGATSPKAGGASGVCTTCGVELKFW
jgi:hypothetical protein